MPLEIVLPQWGMGMNDGMVVKWLKKEGDAIKKGDALVEIESSKVNAEVEAPEDGALGRIVAHEGIVALVGAVLAVMLRPGEDPATLPPATAPRPKAGSAPAQATPAAPAAAAAPATVGPRQVTPIARKVAQELGVDVSSVTGTGPNGRITEDDVRKAASSPTPSAPQPAKPAPSSVPVREVIALTGMRGTIARRMTESSQAPTVTLNTHADVTATTQLMAKLVSDWRQHRLRPQYQDLVLMATVRALKEHPRANAHLVGNEVRVLSEINLGVAVAIADGLLVPVIKNAAPMTLLQVAQTVRRSSMDRWSSDRSGTSA